MHYYIFFLLSLALFIVSPSWAEKKIDSVNEMKNKIAVFDLEVVGKIDKNVSRPLSDSVRYEIMKSGKYEVLERSTMDTHLKEKSFPMDECTEKSCAVGAGKLLGVDKIIVGSISMVGQTYYLSLSRVDVATGKTELVEDDTCKCEIDELINASKRVAEKLTGFRTAEPGQNREKALKGEHPVYPHDENGGANRRIADGDYHGYKGFYAGLYYVFTTAKPPHNNSLFRLQPTSVSGGTGIGLKVGYGFNKYLALESEAATSSFTVNEVTYSSPSTVIKYIPDDQTMQLTVIAHDVKLSYPGELLIPYIHIGYGEYYYSADFQSVSSGLVAKGYAVRTREIRTGAGVYVRLNPSLFFDIRYVTSGVANMTDIGLSYRF